MKIFVCTDRKKRWFFKESYLCSSLSAFLSVLLISFVLVTTTLTKLVTDVSAAPLQQTNNLLQNPGFEQPYSNGAAEHWVRWHRESSLKDSECLTGYHFKPKWNAETNTDRVHDGFVSQFIGNNWDTWAGGMWQTVDVTPGTEYRFTFSGRGRGSNDPAPASSEAGLQMNFRAGVDPNGSGLWNDADVVWGAAGSPHDQWQQFSVEVTATGNQMTVFTAVDWGVVGVNQCRQFLDSWVDSAELVAIAAPPTATSAPPVATSVPTQPPASPTAVTPPTNTPIPTATPEPTATTPAGGTICLNAFADEDGNGLHEAGEGYMAGVTFTIASDSEVVAQAVSAGTTDPICFDGLPASDYQIAQEIPSRLEMTTAGNATIVVADGQTAGLEFGSRLRLANSAANDAAQDNVVQLPAESTLLPVSAEDGASLPAWTGLVVIGLAVILLSVLLFFALRRS